VFHDQKNMKNRLIFFENRSIFANFNLLLTLLGKQVPQHDVYRYRLSIISPFFGFSNYRFLLPKLSITHDNLIFQYLNKIPGFQPKVNIFLKNSIFKKETNSMFGAGNAMLEKLLKTM
jgi:hypothetical protein